MKIFTLILVLIGPDGDRHEQSNRMMFNDRTQCLEFATTLKSPPGYTLDWFDCRK